MTQPPAAAGVAPRNSATSSTIRWTSAESDPIKIALIKAMYDRQVFSIAHGHTAMAWNHVRDDLVRGEFIQADTRAKTLADNGTRLVRVL